MAEGVFRHLTSATPHPLVGKIDSAGTAGYHTGASPDSRTMATLKANGLTKYVHAARQVRPGDFEEFDWIFGMDRDNLVDLQALKMKAVKRRKGDNSELAEVRLVCDLDTLLLLYSLNATTMADMFLLQFGEFGGKGKGGEEINDPYYGGQEGFQTAYEQANRFSKAFLQELEDRNKNGKL